MSTGPFMSTFFRWDEATNLANNGFDIEQRNALVLASNNELQQIVSQDFKNHANVCPIDSADFEIV